LAWGRPAGQGRDPHRALAWAHWTPGLRSGLCLSSGERGVTRWLCPLSPFSPLPPIMPIMCPLCPLCAHYAHYGPLWPIVPIMGHCAHYMQPGFFFHCGLWVQGTEKQQKTKQS
jgi:hypothetical protein